MSNIEHPKVQILKSGLSLRPLHVRFKNCTERNVEVLWINYDGVRVPYRILMPETYFDVDTFVNHIWIFRDSKTYDKMVVSRKEIFQQNPWDMPETDDGPPSPHRKVFRIMLPIYTLKEICFQNIRNCLAGCNHNIYRLSIPRTLQNEYLRFIESLKS